MHSCICTYIFKKISEWWKNTIGNPLQENKCNFPENNLKDLFITGRSFTKNHFPWIYVVSIHFLFIHFLKCILYLKKVMMGTLLSLQSFLPFIYLHFRRNISIYNKQTFSSQFLFFILSGARISLLRQILSGPELLRFWKHFLWKAFSCSFFLSPSQWEFISEGCFVPSVYKYRQLRI